MSAADSWPAHHTLCKRMQQFSSVAIRGRAPYAPSYEGTQRKRCVCVPMLARLRVQTFMYARRKLFYVFTTTCSLAGVSWSCGFAPQRPPCSRLFHAFDRDQSGRADLELPVRAMTHNRPPSPASIHALQQALKKQIHVTHTGTPLRSATTPGKTLLRPLSPSLPAYNNIGISDKATRAGASFDQLNHSYAASVLQDAGLVPGMAITSQSVTFIWPSVPTGQADNYQAAGQVIPVSALPGAATVGFLGASSGGATSGTATLTYTDNSTQTFTLGFTDWWSGSPQFSNQQVAHMTTINTKHGTKSGNFYLYSVTAALNTSKTLQSVTLPTTVSPR